MSANYVYLADGVDANTVIINADLVEVGDGKKIRGENVALIIPNIKPLDVDAHHLYLKYETADNEQQLLRLEGQWQAFKCDDLESVFYDTNHALEIGQDFNASWSYFYKCTEMKVLKGVLLSSDGTVGLITTKGDLVIAGKIVAETVVEDSADKIKQHDGQIKAHKGFFHARNGIELNRGNVQLDEGAIVSDYGNIDVIAGNVKFKHFGYVDAQRGDVHAKCLSHDVITNGEPDKSYEGGVIEGGDGKGHNGTGLYMHAGNKVINEGSTIGADADYIIDGDRGVEGIAQYNPYCYKDDVKHSWLGLLSKHEKVYTVRIQPPQFKSNNGTGYIRSKHGKIDMTCAVFSGHKTFIFS